MTFVELSIYGCKVKIAQCPDGRLKDWGLMTGPRGSRVVHCVDGIWKVKDAAAALGGDIRDAIEPD